MALFYKHYLPRDLYGILIFQNHSINFKIVCVCIYTHIHINMYNFIYTYLNKHILTHSHYFVMLYNLFYLFFFFYYCIWPV